MVINKYTKWFLLSNGFFQIFIRFTQEGDRVSQVRVCQCDRR